jgi:hypothetical protein
MIGFIPGSVISALTFPGVIVHELAHAAFCWLTKTPVFQICYFRFGNPAGFVIHAQPSSVWRHILIGIGPLLINSLVGIGIGLAAIFLHLEIERGTVASGIACWLAVSIAMHSFPSIVDAQGIWNAVWSPESHLAARIIGTPLAAMMYFGAFGSIFWVDVFYGGLVALAVPRILLNMPL